MKPLCLFENTIDEFLRDAVALQVEEADRPADVSQLAGDRLAPSLPAAQVWRDVERGYFFVRVRMIHQVNELVIIPDVTAHIMGFRIMRFQLFHDHAPHVYSVGAWFLPFSTSVIDHFEPRPAASMTAGHLFPSPSTNELASTAVVGHASMPTLASDSTTSRSLSACCSATLSCSITGSGVPLGAARPSQMSTLKPGSTVSAKVGISGYAAGRWLPVVASARILFSDVNGSAPTMLLKASWILPAIRSPNAPAMPG